MSSPDLARESDASLEGQQELCSVCSALEGLMRRWQEAEGYLGQPLWHRGLCRGWSRVTLGSSCLVKLKWPQGTVMLLSTMFKGLG